MSRDVVQLVGRGTSAAFVLDNGDSGLAYPDPVFHGYSIAPDNVHVLMNNGWSSGLALWAVDQQGNLRRNSSSSLVGYSPNITIAQLAVNLDELWAIDVWGRIFKCDPDAPLFYPMEEAEGPRFPSGG
jgi:hypothetical protein